MCTRVVSRYLSHTTCVRLACGVRDGSCLDHAVVLLRCEQRPRCAEHELRLWLWLIIGRDERQLLRSMRFFVLFFLSISLDRFSVRPIERARLERTS